MNKKIFSRWICLMLTVSILTPSSALLPTNGTMCATASDTSSVNATSDDNTKTFANLETITRVYDTNDSGTSTSYYVDEDGKRLSDTATSSENSASLKKATNLPESYDLRTQNTVTSIKDQGVTGCCWAFAAIKSLESNLITKGLASANQLDLSESHLAWYALHLPTQTSDASYGEGISLSGSDSRYAYLMGGNALIGIFSMAHWNGPVTEATAPFSATSQSDLKSMASSMSNKSASLRNTRNYLLTNAVCYDGATQSQIKEAIQTNGAIDVSYYYNNTYDNTLSNNEVAYYQTKYTGTTAIDNANHSVTIIGWDDNYAKENFGENQPSSDGAWLIANSYGTSYGQEGYFWISYEEPSLTEFYSFQGASTKTYDNNYQYDAIGWGQGITSNNSNSISGANIYTASEKYTQSLKAVGIYTLTDNQPYTIKVYRNVTAGKPTSGTLSATISGTAALQGFHTITLPNAVSLKAGERFSVVITYQRENDTTGYLPIEGPDANYDSIRFNYTSNAGESYIYSTLQSADGTTGEWGWYDIQRYGRDEIQNNLCIKAFTKNVSSSGSITLSKSSVTLGKGESFQQTVSVKDISNKSVTYKSKNAKIASVSSTGKITAKKVGKTTITASLSSGRSATIQVTVKKAPKKITLKPSKKKVISRKKSFRIKVKLSAESASNKITFTSSKPRIAKVTSNGKVTAKRKGTTIITVKTFNKKKAKIRVSVK